MLAGVVVRTFGLILLGLLWLGGAAPVCVAPVIPGELTDAGRKALAKNFLSARLDLWRQRLQLTDWRISLEMVEPSELRPGTLGNIRWDFDDGTGEVATIRVLSAARYETPLDEALRDMEFTLVHELIHLEFATMPRSDESRTDEEVAVNRVADALLQLDRQDLEAPDETILASIE